VSNGAGDRLRGAELRAAVAESLRKTSGLNVLLSEAIAERMGMNSSDLEALDLLVRLGPMPAGRLAELTGLTTGGVTGLVDRLERLGFARREADPTDRRKVIVRPLTENALRELGPLYGSMAGDLEGLLGRYTDDELAVVLDFSDRFHKIGLDQIARLRTEEAGTKRRGAPAGGRRRRS
jgi:DNA-binding MarR family transcriptional regulator